MYELYLSIDSDTAGRIKDVKEVKLYFSYNLETRTMFDYVKLMQEVKSRLPEKRDKDIVVYSGLSLYYDECATVYVSITPIEFEAIRLRQTVYIHDKDWELFSTLSYSILIERAAKEAYDNNASDVRIGFSFLNDSNDVTDMFSLADIACESFGRWNDLTIEDVELDLPSGRKKVKAVFTKSVVPREKVYALLKKGIACYEVDDIAASL